MVQNFVHKEITAKTPSVIALFHHEYLIRSITFWAPIFLFSPATLRTPDAAHMEFRALSRKSQLSHRVKT
jgi:hypothetical protein